jgi:hypothetical protein
MLVKLDFIRQNIESSVFHLMKPGKRKSHTKLAKQILSVKTTDRNIYKKEIKSKDQH